MHHEADIVSIALDKGNLNCILNSNFEAEFKRSHNILILIKIVTDFDEIWIGDTFDYAHFYSKIKIFSKIET